MSEQTPAFRTPRWLKITLFASLALNLIVLGLVGGVLASGGPKGAVQARMGNQGATAFVMGLEREDRREIGREIRKSFGKTGKGGMKGRRGLHREALALLRAEDFDASAFQAVLAKQADSMTEVAVAGSVALTEHISDFTHEERLAYADRVEDALERRRPKGKTPKE